jgi:beta-phosphoglucomutase-like phosphatase (HAD superfamily)
MKGLIFSFDNVLCDSKGLRRRAFQNALKEHGYYWTPDMERAYEKRDSGSRLDYLIESRQIKKEDVDLVEWAIDSFTTDMMSEAKFSERAFEILENMKKRGIKIAIASNASRPTIISFLKWTRLNEVVDYVTVTGDDGLNKPNASVYTRTLQKMALNPQDVIVFEGTYFGSVAAKLAGIENIREVSARSLEPALEHLEKAFK